MSDLHKKLVELVKKKASVEIVTDDRENANCVARGYISQRKNADDEIDIFYLTNGKHKATVKYAHIVMVTELNEIYNEGYFFDGCQFTTNDFRQKGDKMIKLKTEHFERIGTASNCHPIYKIHLQNIDKLNQRRATDIVRQAGGVESKEQYFAEFTTIDLPALCKRIERLANGE